MNLNETILAIVNIIFIIIAVFFLFRLRKSGKKIEPDKKHQPVPAETVTPSPQDLTPLEFKPENGGEIENREDNNELIEEIAQIHGGAGKSEVQIQKGVRRMSFWNWITSGFFKRKNKPDGGQISENHKNHVNLTADTKQDINKLINESEKLFESHNKIISEKDEQIRKLETELQEKNATLAGMEGLLQTQQKKIDESGENKIPDKKSESMQKLKNEIAGISKEYQEIIKEYEESTKKLKNEISEISKKYKEASSKLEKERALTVTHANEIENQQRINSELRREFGGHEEAIKKLKNEIAEITSRYQDATEKLDKATDKVASLEMLLIDLDKELGLLNLVKNTDT